MRRMEFTLHEFKELLGLFCLVLLGVSGAAYAQFGHPVEGNWRGFWTSQDGQQNRALLVLQYVDQQITGTINPGRNGVQISEAQLDPPTWTLVLKATGEDADGQAVEYHIEGQLENVTSRTERRYSGEWMQGSEHGTFSVSLQ